jgi:hypothetical protein
VATYAQQMQAIFEQYRQEVSTAPADLRDVGAWAIAKGLWKPRPADVHARFAKDMAESLREEMRTDQAGRRYRSKIAAKVTKNGLPLFVWADLDDAPRPHVENGVALKRRSIVSDGYQLRIDVDHYNEAHPNEPPIQLVLDITDDVEELLIARGIGNDDDEGDQDDAA